MRIDTETAEHFLDTDGKQGLAEWVRDDMTPQQDHRVAQLLRLLYATSATVDAMGGGWVGNSLHVHIDDGNIESTAYHTGMTGYESCDGVGLDVETLRRLESEAVNVWNAMSYPERRLTWARWNNTPIPTLEECREFYKDDEIAIS